MNINTLSSAVTPSYLIMAQTTTTIPSEAGKLGGVYRLYQQVRIQARPSVSVLPARAKMARSASDGTRHRQPRLLDEDTNGREGGHAAFERTWIY